MSRIRILVVEDDVDLRETLEEVLGDEGYDVVTAERGEDAVTLASQQIFDLVVTDIKMPGIDGLEALEQVKQRQPEVKSLVVTGYSSHQDAVRAVKMGVGDYLQKPFGLDSLLARIAEMVAEREAELVEKAKEEAFLQATVTALRLAAQHIDDRLIEAARVAESLATPSTSLWAQAATLALGCRRLVEDKQVGSFGARLEELIEGCQEYWDGSGPQGLQGSEIPAVSQMAALALSRALEPKKAPAEGQFDPELTSRLEGPQKSAGSADLRSLLTLGQAFERGGDLENAFRAYEELLGVAGPGQVMFEATLGQARLERAIHGQNLETRIEELITKSQSLGPHLQVKAHLEGGLLLLPSEKAREHLEKAREESEDELASARSSLGLASLGVEVPYLDAIDVLLRPEHVWELGDAAHWLLPWVLGSSEVVKPAVVVKILREAPQALQSCLEADILNCEQKLSAVDALRAEDSPPLAAVRILSTDADPQVQKALESLHRELKGADVPSLRLLNFGPFTVSRGDILIDDGAWKHQKVKYLLAYLAREWRNPVRDEQLMEEFWPGPADRAKRSLYQATYNLRRCLKDPDSPGIDYIRRERGRMSINPDFPVWNDFREVEEALNGGCRPDNKATLQRALRLYRGPYLQHCYMDWAVTARGSLELKVIEALDWLANDCLKSGDLDSAVQHGRQLFEMDPLNDAGQMLVMKGLVAQKETKAALAHFDACASLLKRELNLEPSIEFLQLQQRAKLEDEPSGLIG